MNLGTEFLVDVSLTPKLCRECGGVYALAKGYTEQRRIKGGGWHCPYCDTNWHYTETDNMRLQRLLKEQEKLTAIEKQRTTDALAEAKHFRKSRDCMKGQITKIKNRVQQGVCPHCNRYFKNLHRHMQSKHKQVL